MIVCIEESMTFKGMDAYEWKRIIGDNQILSPLPIDILPNDINWLRKRSIGFDMSMREIEGDSPVATAAQSDVDQRGLMNHEKKGMRGQPDSEEKKDLRGLMNCEEEKKDNIISFMGDYLKNYHSGEDVACLVIAMDESVIKGEKNGLDKPLFSFSTFSDVLKAITEEFPSYGIIKYNTAKKHYNAIQDIWLRYGESTLKPPGTGDTADTTYLHDMECVKTIQDLTLKCQHLA